MRYIRKDICSLIFAFFVISQFAFSQEDSINSKSKTIVIKYALSSIGGDWVTNSKGIEFGVEFRISPKFSFQQEVGSIFYDNRACDLFTVCVDDISGFRSDTELKHYFIKNNFKGDYIAYHFLFMKTVADISLYVDAPLEVKRLVFANHLKIGWQYIFKIGLAIDLSFGFGVRYISSDNNYGYALNYRDEAPYHKPYDYGSKLFPSAVLGIKIGWIF